MPSREPLSRNEERLGALKEEEVSRRLNDIDLTLVKRRLMIEAYKEAGYKTDMEPGVVHSVINTDEVLTGLEDTPLGELEASDEHSIISTRDELQEAHLPGSGDSIRERGKALASFDEQLARLSIKADELKSRGDTKAYAAASFLFDQLAYQRQRYVYEGKPFKEFEQNCATLIREAQSSSRLKDFRGFGYIINALGNALKSLFGGTKNETASIKVTKDIKESLDTIKHSGKEEAPEVAPSATPKLGGS